ncbi:MAG: PTS fructose transporter subunit IIA [Betaproteobacteria bacterium]|nr:PTS fructose transporter subunit IIA [Betaproteobacteria bacterium]MBI2291265.1 PTS fructose transporter subunit IIA [Betaproteobacteria bacterium]MBI3057238.1 PTS fructose transporter subunit IIA [Betaproteobacteria bacterium]
MIGILIITHGTLGESLIHCASHVLNKRPPRLQQLGVTAQDDPAMLLPRARALVKELDAGEGVLILTDIYGGTPSNMASRLLIPGKVEAVAGVSLPMLIRVLTYRDRDLPTIVTKAISGGCEGVLRVPLFKLHNAAAGS